MWKVDIQTIILSALFVFQSHGFTSHPKAISRTRYHTSAVSLASTANSNDTSADAPAALWNPAQASEFITWHNNQDPENAGLQIRSMIEHWTGKEVAEFLTRMYLGEVNPQEYTISYHPSNVRNPQWLGLGQEGLRYLTVFLMKALPTQALTPAEISRFANTFLLHEHKWPIPKEHQTETNAFQSDSFATIGHSANFARVLGYIRRQRLGDFTPEDVVDLVCLPEMQDKNLLLLNLHDFYGNIGIQLTQMEKVATVEGVAVQGCSPGLIARFMVSSVAEISEEDRIAINERTGSLEEVKALKKLKASSSTDTAAPTDATDIKPPVKKEAKPTKEEPTPSFSEAPPANKIATPETMSKPISDPIKTPIQEIISEQSAQLGLGDFEARWLPEGLLMEDAINVEEEFQ